MTLWNNNGELGINNHNNSFCKENKKDFFFFLLIILTVTAYISFPPISPIMNMAKLSYNLSNTKETIKKKRKNVNNKFNFVLKA